MFLCAQVVGTIGPACQSVDVQVAMLEAGMSAARWGVWVPTGQGRAGFPSTCAEFGAAGHGNGLIIRGVG